MSSKSPSPFEIHAMATYLASGSWSSRGQRCLWDVPAPILNVLVLRNFTFSDNILFGSYPSLRCLMLVDCIASWRHFPISPGLASLHIINPGSRISTADLAECLPHFSNLENLILSGALLEEDEVIPNNQPRSALQGIRVLGIHNEASKSIITLFHRLSIPPPGYNDIIQLRWALGPRKIYLERLPRLVLLVSAPLPSELLSSFGHLVLQISQEVVPRYGEEVGD
ncbi:hypothetical protein BDN72DRAFT_959984 [Pluteus cervinus]|uniref:Uncharacterized protein n=1 Tax=Pluteus cervinus TaxID=181527 RepID=A0ACD3ASZ4_9AGAR|nr:hypothetical protein BDN72DRAFT_959984 [Pluteus cervinus]